MAPARWYPQDPADGYQRPAVSNFVPTFFFIYITHQVSGRVFSLLYLVIFQLLFEDGALLFMCNKVAASQQSAPCFYTITQKYRITRPKRYIQRAFFLLYLITRFVFLVFLCPLRWCRKKWKRASGLFVKKTLARWSKSWRRPPRGKWQIFAYLPYINDDTGFS